jgi:DNA replication protein DnaC
MPPPEIEDILKNLGDLKLKPWRDALTLDWAILKPTEQKLIADSMRKWTAIELAERYSNSIRRRINDAKFIRMQTVDNFDFQYNKSTRNLQVDYLKLHREAAEGKVPHAVFVGNTGLGKTHLARALGYAACQSGMSVLFARASQIVNDLATAKAVHNVERELRKYRRPTLLLIDELGLCQHGY